MTRDIYVSTIIDSHNYGTVMQAVATKEALAPYGRPLFIDYTRPDWTAQGLRDRYLKDESHNALTNVARFLLAQPYLRRNRGIFRAFITRNLDLVDAKPFLEGGNFDRSAVYCVGSDQTWNAVLNKGIDPVYTLKNVPADCTKISFSASFGRPSVPDDEAAAMKPLLEHFDAISVRESSSVAILDGMGIRGAVPLKDPVLLCDPALWKTLSDAERTSGGGYVLVYMLNDNPRMVEYAKLLAARKGVEVRIVTFNMLKSAPQGCRGICQPSPEQWLASFRDASAVVTDSFHGTCFSILFEKPMVVFNPPRFSVRLADVLIDFGLANRRVADGTRPEDITVDRQPVDWESVRGRLAGFRDEARAFLENCMGSATAAVNR